MGQGSQTRSKIPCRTGGQSPLVQLCGFDRDFECRTSSRSLLTRRFHSDWPEVVLSTITASLLSSQPRIAIPRRASHDDSQFSRTTHSTTHPCCSRPHSFHLLYPHLLTRLHSSHSSISSLRADPRIICPAPIDHRASQDD